MVRTICRRVFFWFPKVSPSFYPETNPSRYCQVPRRGPLTRKFAASTRALNRDHLLKRPEPLPLRPTFVGISKSIELSFMYKIQKLAPIFHLVINSYSLSLSLSLSKEIDKFSWIKITQVKPIPKMGLKLCQQPHGIGCEKRFPFFFFEKQKISKLVLQTSGTKYNPIDKILTYHFCCAQIQTNN